MSLPFLEHLLSWRARGSLPLIAEVKIRSADADADPLLRDRTPAAVAAQYERSGAACISVVTGRWFGGNLDLLREVRAATGLPLLRKDFIVSRRDLDVSREAGADAVLLTRRLLRADALSGLAEEALKIGMVPFVEVADRAELDSTPLPAQAVLAINNRDIRVKETDDGDYRNSLSLRGIASAHGARALVSASGIASPDEVTALIDAGFDAVLIGTALLNSPDIGDFFDICRNRLQPASTEEKN